MSYTSAAATTNTASTIAPQARLMIQLATRKLSVIVGDCDLQLPYLLTCYKEYVIGIGPLIAALTGCELDAAASKFAEVVEQYPALAHNSKKLFKYAQVIL